MTLREAIATLLIVAAAVMSAVGGVVIIDNPALGAALGTAGGTLGVLLIAMKMDPRSGFGGGEIAKYTADDMANHNRAAREEAAANVAAHFNLPLNTVNRVAAGIVPPPGIVPPDGDR